MKKITVFCIVVFLCVFIFNETTLPAEEPAKKASIITTPEGLVTLSLDNVLGKDTSVKATGRLTDSDRYIKVGVEKRRLFGGHYFAGADASGRMWNNEEFDLLGSGADAYIGRDITKFTNAILKYRFDCLDVSHTDVRSDPAYRSYDGRNDTSAFSLTLDRTAVDDEFYPKSGTDAALVGEYALKAAGGDYNFSRYEANAACFFTPWRDITFAFHARMGWMEDFGSCDSVPFFEKYFAGSGSTVRGFRWGGAGPKSAQNNPLGGDIIVIGNAEMRVPIYKKLKGAVFFDTGRAFDRIDELGHIDFREGAGLGLRYLTPWVVARVDYGFVVDKKSGDNTGRLHFNLGLPF